VQECAIDGCTNPSRKRGWCEKHYSRWKAHGTPHGPGRVQQAPVCEIEGCASVPLAKNLCRRHYHASRRPPRTARPPRIDVPCAVAGCTEAAQVRGWCGAHYQRWRRFGDPAFHPPAPERVCVIAGCSEVPNARGLCTAHYYRWITYGDPLISKNAPRRQLQERKPFPARSCATCGRSFEPGFSAARKYCGKQCKPSGRIAGSVNKRTWVERLGAEDGWVCWLCRAAVDPRLYWPSSLAGSVDHVVPVIRGGTDERSNLRLAHLRCNTSRRDKPAPEQSTP